MRIGVAGAKVTGVEVQGLQLCQGIVEDQGYLQLGTPELISGVG